MKFCDSMKGAELDGKSENVSTDLVFDVSKLNVINRVNRYE